VKLSATIAADIKRWGLAVPHESNDLTSSRLDLIIPTLLGVAVTIFCIVVLSLASPPQVLGSVLTAVVAIFAIWSAATFSQRADERAKMANSFEIARRWDEEPYLKSRDIVREIDDADLAKKLGDKDVKIAMIHFANYYWEIAVAIETGWADGLYLRERFRATLKAFYPCFKKLLAQSNDSSALEALETISKLHLKWTASRMEPSKDVLQQRLKTLFADIEKF
jgi:hypothetical protein